MNTRKYVLPALALAMIMVLGACGGGGNTSSSTPSTSNPGATDPSTSAPATPTDPNATGPSGNYTMQTNNTDKTVVDIGTFEGVAEGPVLITSVGQSADASMLNALMTKMKNPPEFTFNATATADDLTDVKTVVICSGASSKGLGAAGISADDEKARATALFDAISASDDITVVVAHLGGTARRGELSDEFSDMCLVYADYIIVMEEGNDDGKFSDYAAANGIPVTLVNSIKETAVPLENLFGGAADGEDATPADDASSGEGSADSAPKAG